MRSTDQVQFHRRPNTGRWLLAAYLGMAMLYGREAGAQQKGPLPAVALNQNVRGTDTIDSLQEVIVTARKRNETLIDAPVAVQFLSADQLQRSATQDLAGLGEVVPQLYIVPVTTGSGGIISIRGVSSGLLDNGVESSVSIVFDGVQLSRGLFSQLGLFDVSNVQVLKGPQALFFGKNSPAGVISVSSKDPTDTWQADARAAYEFKARERTIEGAFGGPITDP
jgi:outer membrane receptor protein involved in Fe transport